MKIMTVSGAGSAAAGFAACVKKLGHTVDHYSPIEALGDGLLLQPDLLVVVEHGPFRACDFIRQFRLAGHTELVLALVCRAKADGLIAAFASGADQVCGIDATEGEWAARVLALLRYGRAVTADRICYHELSIEPASLMARREDKVLPLNGKPFSLLEFFARNPEKIHSRERIGESVWDRNFDVFSNVIDVTVSKVRKQLDKGFKEPYLHTIVGRGYMLSEQPPGAAM